MIIGYEDGDWVSLALLAIKNKAPLWFAHGCNCQKLEDNGGIAGQVKERIPALYRTEMIANTNQTGNLSYYLPNGNNHSLVLINLYTQFYGGDDADLIHIAKCFEKLEQIYTRIKNAGGNKQLPQELVIPQIGTGIGGLKWSDVSRVIDESTPTLPVRVIKWNG